MSSKPKWKLYYHRESSRPLAEALLQYSKLSKLNNGVEIEALPNKNSDSKFGTLPYSIRKLLFFGHPDVILTYYDGLQPEKAVFAWEITDAKPATDHWMQRFPSLVGACEIGVPSVFILRFEANTPSWTSKVKSEFFYAYDRVMTIHRIPIYLANWESKSGALQEDPHYPGVPDNKSEAMKDTINFLNLIIDYTVHGRDLVGLSQERLIVELKNKLTTQISDIPIPSSYQRLTVLDKSGYVDTDKALKYLKEKTKKDLPQIPERIKNRKRSLVFVPRPSVVLGKRKNVKEASFLERIEKRNGNPYNGMPLSFDFMFCRLGDTPRERDINLIVDLSELSFKDFAKFHKRTHDSSPLAKTSPPDKKEISRYSLHLTDGYAHEIKDFIRQYCYAADIILLKDFVVPFY